MASNIVVLYPMRNEVFPACDWSGEIIVTGGGVPWHSWDPSAPGKTDDVP